MKEAGAVILIDGSVAHWHVPEDRTSASLPDSDRLWEILWSNRKRLWGFAHTHPGSGRPAPSMEDLTSFAAIESGLGQRLCWWIASSDMLMEFSWHGPGRLDYRGAVYGYFCPEPSWCKALRAMSEIDDGRSAGLAVQEK